MSLTCCTATCYPHFMNLKSAIPTVPASGLHQYMSCHLPAVRPHVIHIACASNLLSLLSLYLDYISICHVTSLLYGHMLSTLHVPQICYPYCPCIWITSVYFMSLTCCTTTCYPHCMYLKSAIPAVRPHVIHIT